MLRAVIALAQVFVLSISLVAPSLAETTIGTTAVTFQGTYRGTASMPGTGLPMRERIVAVGRVSLLGASMMDALQQYLFSQEVDATPIALRSLPVDVDERSTLTDDEAIQLANEELHTMGREAALGG